MSTPADPTQTYYPGLDGVIAGESAICQVHADSVLLYRGYDVHDLAGRIEFDRVAALLLEGKLPDEASRQQRLMAEAMALPGAVVDTLRALPTGTHPMDALRTGVSMAATWHDCTGIDGGYRLAGITNAVLGAFHRARTGGDPVEPDPSRGIAFNAWRAIFGTDPDAFQAKTLDGIYTLYAEHDFNASAFAARVIASTLSDMASAVVGAIGALKGPLHGGANEAAMQMLIDAHQSGDPAAWVKDKLAKRQKIMGFGHRVYKKGDSRTTVLREMLREAGERAGEPHWYETGRVLERVVMEEKGLPGNADLYAAPLFRLLGIPSDLNTPLFAGSRVVGWCAHVIEQLDNNRLIRPRGRYVGPERRAVDDHA
jgi:citrate synthase